MSKKVFCGLFDYVDFFYDDVMDYFVFCFLELCGGIKSNVFSFVVCLEFVDYVCNEIGKGFDSLLK